MIHLKARCKLIACRGKRSKYYFPPGIEKRLDTDNDTLIQHSFISALDSKGRLTGLFEEGCKGGSSSGRHQKTRDTHRRSTYAKFVNALGSLLDPVSLGQEIKDACQLLD